MNKRMKGEAWLRATALVFVANAVSCFGAVLVSDNLDLGERRLNAQLYNTPIQYSSIESATNWLRAADYRYINYREIDGETVAASGKFPYAQIEAGVDYTSLTSRVVRFSVDVKFNNANQSLMNSNDVSCAILYWGNQFKGIPIQTASGDDVATDGFRLRLDPYKGMMQMRSYANNAVLSTNSFMVGYDRTNDWFRMSFEYDKTVSELTWSVVNLETSTAVSNSCTVTAADLPDPANMTRTGFYVGKLTSANYVEGTTPVTMFDNFSVEDYGEILLGYDLWADDHSVGEMGEDPDEDNVDNLEEYAFGGNPSDPDDMGTAFFGTSSLGGTNYYNVIHLMLIDTNEVEYIVEVNDDLVSGSWTNSGSVMSSGAYDESYDLVTNAIPMDAEQGFIRLRVNQK
ncbi:hypothetical protein [Pontiella sulfatireligans]|uniref:Uncharacterized protein n=1 Tax=Pontiella sulfatireligans TaxID=2750658 RepID=A0A6C2UMK4_9BACT|nr:hypothetical protein [Pontiella sulfatireligans]VGO20657.1 hypothetical protein SCARR_02723 [Pontiella sulfatireligans]